jgi:hypothetical protein
MMTSDEILKKIHPETKEEWDDVYGHHIFGWVVGVTGHWMEFVIIAEKIVNTIYIEARHPTFDEKGKLVHLGIEKFT